MTNFEKITRNTQTLAEVIKDCQEMFYCGQCPALEMCRDLSGLNAVDCYAMIAIWLESEVIEND